MLAVDNAGNHISIDAAISSTPLAISGGSSSQRTFLVDAVNTLATGVKDRNTESRYSYDTNMGTP